MKAKKILSRLFLGLFCVSGVTLSAVTLASCNDTEVEVAEYTITFNTDGGSSVSSVKVKDGEKVAKPSTNPTKEGYTFKHWSTTKGGSEYDFSTAVSGNLTLYAVWEENAPEPVTTYTVTFVTGEGGSPVQNQTVNAGAKATKPTTNPTKNGYTFKYWSTTENGSEYDFNTAVNKNLTLYAVWEENSDVPPANTVTVTFVVPDEASSFPPDDQEISSGEKATKPADPEMGGYKFKHWSTTENGEAYDFNTPVTTNLTLYAVFEKNPEQIEYEEVTRVLDVTRTDFEVDADGKTVNDEVVGYFTLGKGMKAEGDCYNTQGKLITFTTSSEGVLTVNMKGGSKDLTKYSIYDKNGVEILSVPFTNNDGQKTITWNIPEAGTYSFGGDKSVRIYSMQYTEMVEKSDPASIEVTTLPEVNFLEGSEFNSNGINVTLHYENGRTDVVEGIVTPLTAEQMSNPGQYDVTVTYNVSGFDPFTTTYKVTVYGLESLSLSSYDYANKTVLPVQKIFLLNDPFNYNNLVVTAHAKVIIGEQELTHDFVLSSADYSVQTPDLSSIGDKEVIVKSTLNEEIKKSYLINVVNNVVSDVEKDITINVVESGEVVVNAEGITFSSINDALKYLELVKIADKAIKTINIAEGTYKEKIEVVLPNVHFVGANNADLSKETLISWNDYNGKNVPSGLGVYSTDGSSTVTISASAVGFEASNISFENEINTLEEYNSLKEITKDTQAVAVMVEADQSKFTNVRFSGYQDTLYARNGRQYYINCYIEGRTDYIFGEDATAIFVNSEIHHLPSPSGDANKNGGYVIATKGTNADKENPTIVNYGYIFDNCTFTAAEDVVDGTVSIARGWDDYMTVMVMNSELGAHISKEAYGEATLDADEATPAKDNKNDRYGNMNADPDPSRLLEYNNTGEGAISQSLDKTCTVYTTPEEASAYLDEEGNLDLLQVYGKDTNNVPYDCDWTGGVVDKDATINYYDGEELLYTQYDYVDTTLDSLWTAPTKEGLTFVGWYTTSTFEEGTEYNIEVKLTETTNLYAKYEASSGEVEHVYTLDAATLFTELGLSDTKNLKEFTLYGEVFTFSAGMRLKADCFSNNKTQSVYDSTGTNANAYIEFDIKGSGSLSIEISSSGRNVYIYSIIDNAIGTLINSFDSNQTTQLEAGKYVIMFNADGENPNIEPKITKIELKDTF